MTVELKGRQGHLGVVQLGFCAAQLLAKTDGFGLSLVQRPRHILQFSLQGRDRGMKPSNRGFHSATPCASNPSHTGRNVKRCSCHGKQSGRSSDA